MTSDVRPPDEIANLVTHGAGFVLSLGAAWHLMSLAFSRSTAVFTACSIYSAALILVYGSSTLSHLFYDIGWRRVFRTLDQACIFLLISGTFTPFAVLYLNQGPWWILLTIMWLAALAGVLRVLQVRDLSPRDKLLFGILGFLPATAAVEFSRHAPIILLVWILAGGVCYCLGAPFLRCSSRIRYSHAAWHLCVIAGSACHYYAVLLAMDGTDSGPSPGEVRRPWKRLVQELALGCLAESSSNDTIPAGLFSSPNRHDPEMIPRLERELVASTRVGECR